MLPTGLVRWILGEGVAMRPYSLPLGGGWRPGHLLISFSYAEIKSVGNRLQWCQANSSQLIRIINNICFCCVFAATPEPGEDPRVTRAKYFIRDEFLVSGACLESLTSPASAGF